MEILAKISEQIVISSRLIKESAKDPNANLAQLAKSIKDDRAKELLQLAKGSNS